MKLLSGNSNKPLSKNIAKYLKSKLVNSSIRNFSDGEIYVEINENIRGNSIFIIQSVSSPANDNLMELLLCIDALKRSSAKNITAVIPYFGYARQDRRPRSARVPISAKMVADILGTVGINRILTVDLHADQIQGFFNVPVDNVYGSPVLIDDAIAQNYHRPIVVSPDVGGVVRARAYAKQINDTDLAIIDKRRARANESEVMNIIGDVRGRTAILVDDIVDTAGTLSNAATALKESGAEKVVAYCTHAVLSGPAIDRISKSDIDEVIVTDTIPLFVEAVKCGKIRQLSLDRVLAEAIRRVSNEESLSAMFR